MSEYLDTLGLVKSCFFKFFEKNKEKNRKKNVSVLRRPEDEANCLFAGLLANPDVPLSLFRCQDANLSRLESRQAHLSRLATYAAE